jgi:hypothetical protein
VETFALAPVRRQFRCLAASIVPECEALTAAQWTALEAIVENALSERPPAMVRQLGLFIRAIGVLSVLRHGVTFGRLDAERRFRFLNRFENSSVLLMRRGFWGLRTLVYMGYYGQPQIQRSIGYRAHPDGWAARG